MVEEHSREVPHNETRLRILDAAESLFASKGYAAVTLREIGNAVGMRHASLYYYAPAGKEGLFVEVMERSLKRHGEGLIQAVAAAGDDLREQIYAVVEWFAVQPQIGLVQMQHIDLPALNPDAADRLRLLLFNTLRTPVALALRRAERAGVAQVENPSRAAMALIALLHSVHGIPGIENVDDRRHEGRALADMLLWGWFKR